MTKCRMLAILGGAGFAIALSATLAAAQATRAPAARGPEIAVIDVNKIFKDNERFKAQMADLQARVEKAEAYFKKQRENIRSEIEVLKGLQPSSPDYRQREENIARMKSDMAVQAEMQDREFSQQRVKILYQTYLEIQQVVDEYAARAGIAAVLRVNTQAPDPNKAEEVAVDMQKQVLWWHQSLDITPAIQQELNRRMVQPQISTRPNNAFPARPQ